MIVPSQVTLREVDEFSVIKRASLVGVALACSRTSEEPTIIANTKTSDFRVVII
jgi:arginine/ornithine N-succinyltransferase beta subunit